MLTKITPDQVASMWDVIRDAIEKSLPPISSEDKNRMNNILTSLLCGKSHCWMSYVKNEDKNIFEGLLITRIIYDDISDCKNLLIYCIYGYEFVGRSSWTEGLKTLVKYAAGLGCSNIVAYSSVPSIISLIDKLGGDTSFKFIKLPLSKN
jgi:hypothetical protein